ncbi:MAG TPA: hypothetical protein PLL20_20275 [Phycisphaerae bacterium]|nr:hypothetical protein [Phycisphaerae bacterium]HRR86626.1 hypothetical protein [Phycisphaerae bacterium]
MNKVFLTCGILLTATSAFANLIQNGSFETGDISGWTYWHAPWCVNCQAVVQTGSGTMVDGQSRARLQISNGEGSFGLYQVVAVPTDKEVTLEAWVRATSNNVNWAEVLLYDYAVTDINDIDSGEKSAPYMIWKRDSWGGVSGLPGGYLPTVATSGGPGDSWEMTTKTLTSVPSGVVTVAFKWGRSGGGFSGSMYLDAITLTPEPAMMLLLGLPALFLRRRRL